MIYRPFGKTDVKVSRLGFGCMRFPLTDENNPAKIDEPKATELLHYAIDSGINLLDNAWPYHREMSEKFVGKTLKDGYREKVYVSTKLPVWLIKEKGNSRKYFNEQLKRLQTDTFDLYLLHALGKTSWKIVKEFDVLAFLDEVKAAGKIRYPGFSFHDELPLFKEIVDAYPWAFCLIHLNYVDDDFQAGIEGLEYAHNKGLAVMVMEPLRGGKLANNVPSEILEIIKESGRKQTPAEFALRFLYNRPEVRCVLSGMSTVEQVQQNIEFTSKEHVNTLSAKELSLYARAKEIYKSRIKVNCTQCGYCMPCSQKIPISFILGMYNDAYMYEAIEDSRWMYRVFVKPENRADKCTACSECEEKCPQKISIAEHLKKAHKVLSEDKV